MYWLPVLNWAPQWAKSSTNQKDLSMTEGGREVSLTRLLNDKSVQHYTTLVSLESTLNETSFSSCLVQHLLPNPPFPSITHLLVPAIALPNCVVLCRISFPKQAIPLIAETELPYHLQPFVTEEPLAQRVLFPIGSSFLKEAVTVTFLPGNRTIISMSDLIGSSSERKSTVHSLYQGPQSRLSSSDYFLPTDLSNPVATLTTTYNEICQFCAARGLLECTCAPAISERAKKASSVDPLVDLPEAEAFNPFETVAQQDWASAATHLAAHSFDTVRFSNALCTDPSGHSAQDRWISDGTLNYRYEVGPGASPELEQEFKLRYLQPQEPTNLPDLSQETLSSLLSPDFGSGLTNQLDQAGPSLLPQLPQDSKYKCPECNDLFNSVDRLEVHFGVKHPKSKLVKCDRCHKSFRNRSNRDKHKKIVHLRLMNYPCPVCPDVSFGQRWDLNRHINSHTDKGPEKRKQRGKDPNKRN